MVDVNVIYLRRLNAIQAANTSNGNTGFVTKLNPAGSELIYSTYIGGSVFGDATETLPYAIAVDSSGSAYITGFTNSPKFPATAGAYQTVCGALGTNGLSNCPGAQSAFVTKFSPTGGLVYSTFFGHSNETGISIAVDANGQAYIAGDTVDQCGSSNTIACFPTTPNAVLPGSTFNVTVNTNNFNQGSGFISVFDAAGANLLYSSLFGGNGDQSTGNGHPTYGSGVAVDPSGFFYLTGTTGSNQLPVTQGAFQNDLLRRYVHPVIGVPARLACLLAAAPESVSVPLSPSIQGSPQQAESRALQNDPQPSSIRDASLSRPKFLE